MESASSVNMAITTSSALTYTNSRSTSKYRGVVWLRSGKWGSRIAFRHKAHWLGTYEFEEEAAMAYDRAALKLQRSDAPINFPMSLYTIQEMRFQGQYSQEEVLKMIKEKTYVTKFSEFFADQSLARRFQMVMNLSNQNGGISYQLLFYKELTQTDLTHVKGFHIPKEYAVQYFPRVSGANSEIREGEKRFVELMLYDKHYRAWTFRYSFWKSTKTFVFTKGWRHFVKMNSLKAKDFIFFYRCRGNEGNVYYMIDVQQAGNGSNLLMGQGTENGVEVEEIEEEETGNEVKLFGVLIGKRKRANE